MFAQKISHYQIRRKIIGLLIFVMILSFNCQQDDQRSRIEQPSEKFLQLQSAGCSENRPEHDSHGRESTVRSEASPNKGEVVMKGHGNRASTIPARTVRCTTLLQPPRSHRGDLFEVCASAAPGGSGRSARLPLVAWRLIGHAVLDFVSATSAVRFVPGLLVGRAALDPLRVYYASTRPTTRRQVREYLTYS